jgi:hypothetical protein
MLSRRPKFELNVHRGDVISPDDDLVDIGGNETRKLEMDPVCTWDQLGR